MIDTKLKLNHGADHELTGRIDSEKIGVYGLSLGDLTTALVSFHPDLIVVWPPCPELEAMNGLKQQWLTRIITEAFFDSNLRNGEKAENAAEFLSKTVTRENTVVRLRQPIAAHAYDVEAAISELAN